MEKRKLYSAFVFSFTLLLMTAVAAYCFHHRHKSQDHLSVTGLSKRNFVSDLITWKGTYYQQAFTLKQAFKQLKKDKLKVVDFVKAHKFKEEDLLFSSIDISPQYETTYQKDGQSKSTFVGYRLSQSVELESKEVQSVESLAREITELIDLGVEIHSSAPRYYSTQLSNLKLEMLAEATENAKLRAQSIATHGGGKLGKLKQARMGVFQITAQNSSENYSWGGTFNTSSKHKTAAITVKLDYALD